MNKLKWLTLSVVMGLTLSWFPGFTEEAKPVPAETKVQEEKTEAKKENTEQRAGIIDTSYEEINAMQLVRDADQWIGKKVSFQGVFNSFHPYALDYKKAMRDSKDYISFLVLRPDVKQHKIPMSELKLIYPRKKAEDIVEIEGGDTILVKGEVFSAALGDPWLDVNEIVILKKTADSKIDKDKKAQGETEE